MEFSLLYPGTIPTASKNRRRSPEKHAIRKVFHHQLKRLWYTSQQLRLVANDTIKGNTADLAEATDERVADGLQKLSSLFMQADEYRFVPLVTEALYLRCSLDILLLRPNERRFLFTQGDIDGQLKTILDALRMPNSPQELPGTPPEEDEKPFFCLMQDDRLVTQVKVTSQDLLLLPGERELKANDAFAIIHVKVNELYPTTIMNLPYFDLLKTRDQAEKE